jgi:hypothetical protein
MAYVAEFVEYESTILYGNARQGRLERGFQLPPEAEERWNEILSPLGQNAIVWGMRLEKTFGDLPMGVPWAIVAFPESYRLAGHLAEVRESRQDFGYAGYLRELRQPVEEFGVPDVGVLFVWNRSAFERAAERSELLRSAWRSLRELPPNRHWFCIADPPPADWVEREQEGDDARYLRWSRAQGPVNGER